MKVYRKGTELDVRFFNFALHQGGVGDLIACLPAIKYVLDHHPQIHILLWVHNYAKDLCQTVFSSYTNIDINCMSDMKKYYKDDLPCRSPYIHKITNLASNMVEHGFYTLAGTSVEDKYKDYIQLEPISITHFNLPEKYVVVTTGYTSKVRAWSAKSIDETVDYILSKGLTPVFLGKSNTPASDKETIIGNFEADYTKPGTINLINKTNLFEAHAIMNNAEVTMGLDNGLLHLCGMGKGKAIWGFTTVLPSHRLPFKNGIQGQDCLIVMPTEEELRCIGCQSKFNFAPASHCFTTCFYKDYKCLDLMTSDRWIEQLKKLDI